MDLAPNTPLLSLDLEMAQPSGRIIQIGACVCDLDAGKIVADLSVYVNPGEKISDYIVSLTGITQDTIDRRGVSLQEAYDLLLTLHRKYGCHRQPLTWGGADSAELKRQLNYPNDYIFGFRWTDVKTVYQSYRMANRKSTQGGLKGALRHFSIMPLGRHHNALMDSKHTFLVFHKLCQMLKQTKGAE